MTLNDAAVRAKFVRERLPKEGLFEGQTWRTATEAFTIEPQLAEELERLGPMLAEFYRACNLLYRHSASGKLPTWVAHYLDLGKPSELIAAARCGRFKADLPRVIRPDVLLTESSFVISELDSVPGGIGLTGWLYQTYGELEKWSGETREGMVEGFWSILGAETVRVVISEESAGYRPEMHWLTEQLRHKGRQIEVVDLRAFDVGRVTSRNRAQATPHASAQPAIYRFFELFDIANEPNAQKILDAAARGELRVTPPFKPWLEEKMLFAFLWHSQLRDFWRMELGGKTLARLQQIVPYTWIVDPTPLPPHAAIPELGIQDWRQLAKFSQTQRELVLKVSGFCEHAWGSRGVWVGHDLPASNWAAAIENALKNFERRPCILQRFHKSKVISACYYDFDAGEPKTVRAKTRLCPYYFVSGANDKLTVKLGGILATICPAENKLLHGKSDAIMAPCKTGNRPACAIQQ